MTPTGTVDDWPACAQCYRPADGTCMRCGKPLCAYCAGGTNLCASCEGTPYRDVWGKRVWEAEL